MIDEHVSSCGECGALMKVVKDLADDVKSLAKASDHPDASELASLYYGSIPNSASSSTAAHVARCRDCASQLAEYARAERAANEYQPARAKSGEAPSRAWELIREWEESIFAVPKEAEYTLSREMIAKLARRLTESKEELEAKRGDLTHPVSGEERAHLVPVMVVDRSGEVRGIEMFEKAADQRGGEVLSYVGASDRFDQKPFHALLDFGDQKRVVVTDLVVRDKIRLPRVDRADAELRGADYFIIED